MVLSAEAKPDMLESLAKNAPKADFYLLRLISEHPRVSSKTLNRWRSIPTLRFAKMWRGTPIPILRRWHCFLAIAASRCGIWWRSTRIRLRRCGGSCKNACASSAKTAERSSNYSPVI